MGLFWTNSGSESIPSQSKARNGFRSDLLAQLLSNLGKQDTLVQFSKSFIGSISFFMALFLSQKAKRPLELKNSIENPS
jgi:hypothetical protein